MHVLGDGIVSYELAYFSYYGIRIKKWFTLDELNAAIHKYKFPKGVSIPALHPKVAKGTEDGRPHKGATVHYSASQMLQFALHSVAIFEPLLQRHSDKGVSGLFCCTRPVTSALTLADLDCRAWQALTDGAWLSWLSLVKVCSNALQHSFSLADRMALDKAVKDHHQCFQAVKEYEGFLKPKHHEASHFAVDIEELGPLRHIW